MGADRTAIRSCDLSLARATERCNSVYGDCSKVAYNEANFSQDPSTEMEFLLYVTRSCPKNYKRFGCCACMRACEAYPQIFDLSEQDKHNYCYKKAAIVS